MGKRDGWYAKSAVEVLRELNASATGLGSREAARRHVQYGNNALAEAKHAGAGKIFVRQFRGFIVWVLLLSALVSYFTNHRVEMVVILITVFISILLGFFEEWRSSKEMESLAQLSAKRAVVLRDGQRADIDASQVTVGDIIVLERGSIVPADARIVEANGLLMDESMLTGESHPVQKVVDAVASDASLGEESCMVFGGTHITTGTGKAVVVGIGGGSEMGKIARLIHGIEEKATPLQHRIDQLGKQLSIAAIILSFAVFILGIARGNEWSAMLILSLMVLVSGIPEGLPTGIALALSIGVRRMAARHAIVKRLSAVETLGTCTVICSDKTGTLTQNKMVIEKILAADHEITVTGVGYDPKGVFLKENVEIDPRKHKGVAKILEIGVLCNNSQMKKERGQWKVEGESTEGALVVLANKAGIKKEEFAFPRAKEHPFDPVRKMMTTVHTIRNKQVVYTKGAPETILKRSKYYFKDGRIVALDKVMLEHFSGKISAYASQGLRVLGLAFKEHRGSLELTHVEKDLVFAGLVCIRDPPVPGVQDAIKRTQEAGVRVVMITGDNELTARAIGIELGILRQHDRVLTGQQLDAMNDRQFEAVVEDVAIYARTSPEHKLRIVTMLQRAGHIVGMTGDGVNDAPALKKADIGIAMGKRGTEVAREAAELVLLDDNFTTIVAAIEQGRTIYENIRKFLYYLLLGNIALVLLVVIAVFAGVQLPFTALMILFINLVTGDIFALGLGREKASPGIMKQKPRHPHESILSEYLLFRTAEVVPVVILGTLGLYLWALAVKGVALPIAQTMAFLTIILFLLFHSLNAKSWTRSIFSKDVFANWYIIGGILVSLSLTVCVIYVPLLQSTFGTAPLGWRDWLPCVGTAFIIIFLMEIQKTLVNAEMREREMYAIVEKRD